MTFEELINNIIDIVESFIWLAMSLGLLYFVFGVVKYLTSYDDEKARSESVKTISYGLIALFVMVAVWGLVQMLAVTILGNGQMGIPQF